MGRTKRNGFLLGCRRGSALQQYLVVGVAVGTIAIGGLRSLGMAKREALIGKAASAAPARPALASRTSAAEDQAVTHSRYQHPTPDVPNRFELDAARPNDSVGDDRGIRDLEDAEEALREHLSDTAFAPDVVADDPEFLRDIVKNDNIADSVRLAALLKLTAEKTCSSFWQCVFDYYLSDNRRIRPIDAHSCRRAGLSHDLACQSFVEWLTIVPGLAFLEAGDRHPWSANDIWQGSVNSCFYLSALGSVALLNPPYLREQIRDNADGTYTVTFYRTNSEKEIEPVEVTVSAQASVNFGDLEALSGPHNIPWLHPKVSLVRAEVWTRIYEHAYAELQGGYGEIDGGMSLDAMVALTGKGEAVSLAGCAQHGCFHKFMNDEATVNVGNPGLFDRIDASGRDRGYEQIRTWAQDGRPITVGNPYPEGASEYQVKLAQQNHVRVAGHSYLVESVTDERIVLRDPYAWNGNPESRVAVEDLNRLSETVVSATFVEPEQATCLTTACGRIELSRDDFLDLFAIATAGAPIAASEPPSTRGPSRQDGSAKAIVATSEPR